MLLAVGNYDYWENSLGPVLRIICRDKEGKRVILDVQDEELDPRFYVLESDFPIIMETLNERYLSHNIKKVQPGYPTYDNQRTIQIRTQFPWQIKKIRDSIPHIKTFNADIKWEKMCFQNMKWKAYLEVEGYDKYGILKCSQIKNTSEEFKPEWNIAYWDIETNHSAVMEKNKDFFKLADQIPIISYVIFSSKNKVYRYYAWREDFETSIQRESHISQISETIRTSNRFESYLSEYPVDVFLFSNEQDMHIRFLEDFAKEEYDGLVTFNGRGGQKVLGKTGKKKGDSRKWFNGYDMPLFHARCIHLGLDENLQKISPIPFTKKNPSVVVHATSNKITREEEKHEIFIKGIPQHDLYYDDMVLFYSKNEYEMKRHNLDTFLRHFLGIKKVEHEGEMVWELFKRNWRTEKLYNITDVEGLYALDLFFKYTDDVAGRALVYGGKIEDGVYASKIHDHINLFKTSGSYVFNTISFDDNEKLEEDYNWEGMINEKIGGFNLEPKPGIYGFFKKQFGFVLDFSKLYPTCSMTANADIRTKINLDHFEVSENDFLLVDDKGKSISWNDCTHTPAGFFRKDILALDTIIYKELISERKKFQKLQMQISERINKTSDLKEKENLKSLYNLYNGKQFSYKGLINGKFGTTGREGTRSYDKVIYNTLPAMGQMLILRVIDLLIHTGYEPLLASTDSVFCITKEDQDPIKAFEEATALCEKINNEILPQFVFEQFNPIECHVKMDCEKIFDLAIIADMRRYFLNVIVKEEDGRVIVLQKPEILFKGFEYVRRDSALITNEVQGTFMNMLREKKTKEEIFEYIRDIDRGFAERDWNQICGSAGISDDVDEHEGQKYTACRNANTIFGKSYNAGSFPYLGIFRKYPKTYNSHYLGNGKGNFVMAFDENDQWELKKLGFDLDYESIKETHVIKKIEPLLKLVFNKDYKTVVYGKTCLYEV